MSHNKNTHISFDLDGTLIDSFSLMKKSWENANEKLGLDISWINYREHIGQKFSKICANLGIENRFEEIQTCYFDYNAENIHQIKAIEGLDHLLHWLSTNKVSWSIVTSKPRYTTERILNHFQIFPHYLVCSDDIGAGKPNGEAAELLKERFGEMKIIYVGDTVIDHLFAINGKFDFIYVANQNTEIVSENFKGIANYIKNDFQIVRDLTELTHFLQGKNVDC